MVAFCERAAHSIDYVLYVLVLYVILLFPVLVLREGFDSDCPVPGISLFFTSTF